MEWNCTDAGIYINLRTWLYWLVLFTMRFLASWNCDLWRQFS